MDGFFGPPRGESGGVNPWAYWDAATIARAAQCPQAAVNANWPGICRALIAAGQGSRRSQAGAIGTISVETAYTFAPLHEYGTPADWAHYSGGAAYAGRGYVQLTHNYNYQAVGGAIGVDLLGNPDLAMDPAVAALIFAEYWRARDIQSMADRGDWLTVRKAVVGYVANPPGYAQIFAVVTALGA